MNSAAWLVIGLVIGASVGWVWTTWRLDRRLKDALGTLRTEEQQRRHELAASKDLLAELQAGELELQQQLSLTAGRVEELLDETKEQKKELERAEARIFDRESTIDSLRSKLYAARNSATDLENELETRTSELEILQERFNTIRATAVGKGSSDADALSSIVVDLGDTLSIERD